MEVGEGRKKGRVVCRVGVQEAISYLCMAGGLFCAREVLRDLENFIASKYITDT